MPSRPEVADCNAGTMSAHIRAAWAVSLTCVVWTAASSAAAIAIGITTSSGSLVAVGAVGFVDALGSATLAYHFRHAMRHEQTSDRLEAIAHRVVSIGLVAVGTTTVIVNSVRLASGSEADATVAGAVLAAVSCVVLAFLAGRKLSIARDVGSPALRSDAHLSLVGSTLAGIAILGMAATNWLGWSSADAVAAVVVGIVAAIVGVVSGGWSQRPVA
jgi:divalent metal cation (Fe/Co/Zn/Cd) transporter